jgi:hypothetical protein
MMLNLCAIGQHAWMLTKDKTTLKTKISLSINVQKPLQWVCFGELACARYLDAELNLDFTKGGDDGNDLEAWGLKWQIKTSSIRKLIFNWHPRF